MHSLAVLTSGGDSPGMNAAVRAVVRCGLAAGVKVFTIERGYEGLLAGRFNEMASASVAGYITAGGSNIKSARSAEMYSPGGPESGAQLLHRRGIDGLVVVGGDGTYRAALELARHGVKVVGLPGTIDNDIPGTERTIGFDTAVNTLADVLGKLRDTAASHNRTFVVEAMGRHSGWIALHAGLASGADLILLPEVPWTREDVLARLLLRCEQGKTFHLVVMAEGAGNALELAAWLHEQTPEALEVRACIPGHIQRGGTPSVLDRLFATACGARAVEALLAGRHGVMIGEQAGQIAEVPLSMAIEGKRTIDASLHEVLLKVS
jgi:6-phosphofructokinase 1